MNKPAIPDAAVEAALEAFYAKCDVDFDGLPAVKAALEAAAPHMLAEAWDMAYEIGRDDEWNKHSGLMRANPHR